MLTEAQAAYFAGIMDGEGCLSVRKQGRSYGVQIIVVQKDPIILHWIQEHIGGHVDPVHRHAYGKDRTYWRWTLGGKQSIVPLLEAIIPYLTLKKERATLCLALANTMLDGGKGWTVSEKLPRGKAGRPASLPENIILLRQSLVQQLCQLRSS